MLFEVGIPNLVHRCIVCVCHVPFLGHCDLDLVIRIIVATTYLLYYLRWESRIWCGFI